MTGTGDREAEKAAREAAWWKRWWAEDFSWEALGKRYADGTPHKPWTGWSVTPDGQCVETASAPEGSKPATLQDYFRWNPDAKRLRSDEELLDARLLIKRKDEEGRTQNEEEAPDLFHILHLPQAYADGTPTSKSDLGAADWAHLEAHIARLLDRSGPTDNAIRNEDCNAADHRAQLHGAVLRAFPRPPAPERPFSLHLAAKHAVFLAPADASGVEFGSPAILAQALFRSTADFSNAQFSSGYANFSEAQFSGGNASFSEAQFSGGDAYFSEAQFSGGNAYFSNTQFSGGYAYFSEAQFSGGDAYFSEAQFFDGDAYFSKAQFSGGNAYFSKVQFSGGNAYFSKAQFSGGDAYFLNTQFSGKNTDFSKAQFSGGNAYFLNTQFSGGNADFLNTQFSGGDADFSNTQFSGGNADFSNTQFSGGNADFSNTQFSGGNADFSNATFTHGTSFAGARFLKTCEFGRSDQPGGRAPTPGAQFLGRLNVRGAYFEGRADFSRVRFPEKAEDRNSAFEGARFFEPLDLKGVERLPFSAFHGIRLDKGLLLDSHHPEPEQFEEALADAEAAIVRDDAGDPEDPGRDPERSGADARYAALEAGCRALKEAMAADGDRKREQSFFCHELAARERRVRHRLEELKAGPASLGSRLKALSVRAELTASQAYRFFSGYGGSILRPLVTLLASFPLVAAALGFLTFAFALAGNAQLSDVCLGMECGPTMHPIASNTLEAAFRGMLGPFRLLLGRGEPFAYLGDTAPVFRGLVALVILLHGLVSSALIFLGLLALRRQFQIN